MGCCGKVVKKVKNIAIGYSRLAIGVKYKDTDKRTRICQGCEKGYWIKRTLWCRLCKCYVQAKARVEDEICPLDRW